MRFRLRTLLIVLALGPAVLAGLWLNRDQFASGFSFTMALVVVVGVSLWTLVGFVLFSLAVHLLELMAELLGQNRR